MAAALQVFWLKGYDGASLKDLTSAMGINSPSLYAEFGDKRSLYLEAIRLYSEDHGCAPLTAFQSEADIERAVHAFLNAALEHATHQESGARGCFLSSCVATSAGEVEGVEGLLQEAIMNTDQIIAARFDSEKENGNLPQNFPSLERARLLLDLRQGHVFRARAGFEANSMMSGIDYRVDIVLQQ
ncbi:MAG: TetR/AcrR family transcriptional regulator [Halocynthiibacter sp.]